ncbi:helix-turn-helix transcriptional regulator [Ruminococcus sp.]|uniref:helix-turn-helix domain-containing protein n=1 Tax=Ruminococcus sp. TaxID=41978 RepID=UPI0025D3684A|nr:helix-turn-helix transcriptional regulator [Ruminococcus sp.]
MSLIFVIVIIYRSHTIRVLEPEYTIMQAMIDARTSKGLTQKELSIRSGIAQGDISKLENGNANPSIRTLQRLATAMGKTLRIEFL